MKPWSISPALLSGLLLTIVMTAPSRTFGQQTDSLITIGNRIVFPSKVLKKDIQLSVHLPGSYRESLQRYPVLITFQTHFEQVAGAVKNLYDYSLTPEIIVIRIDNYEFGYLTPVMVEDDPNTGKADDFLRFFKEELFPYLDGNYRTCPYRIVFSNSWGGLFCAYAILARPDVFNAAVASVPWVIFDGEEQFMIKNAKHFLDAGQYHNHFLYLAADNETELFPDLQIFADVLKDNPREGLTWEFHHWPEEDHYSTAARAIYWGLRTLYAPWAVVPEEIAAAGLESVKGYENSLNDRYRYPIGLSYSAIRVAAQNLRNAGDYEKAIDLLRLAITKKPEDAFAWVNLGRTYEECGQIEPAREAFETAYRFAVEKSHPQVKWVKSFLDKLNAKSSAGEDDD